MRLTLLLGPFRVSVRLAYDEVILEVTSGPFSQPIEAIRSLIVESLNVALAGARQKGEIRENLATFWNNTRAAIS